MQPRTFVCLFALVIAPQVACGAPAFRAGKVAHGKLQQEGGVWLLELSGTPEQRGAAAGELLAPQIRWSLPRYLEESLHSDQPVEATRAIIERYRAHVPPDHLAQLTALAKAAGVDPDALLLANLAPEVFGTLACSCMAAVGEKSASGEVMLARNLDWYGGGVLRDLGLVVIEDLGSRRIASVTWPGLVGVVTGINDRGLTVANLVVLGERAIPKSGVPVMFALRSILENQTEIAGAVTWLEGQQRTVPQNYAFADPHGALVLETWRPRFRKRPPTEGYVAVGNLFDEDKGAHPKGRYVEMARIGKSPKLDVAAMQAALQEVALAEMNVQAVVILPAKLRIYGSTSTRPAAAGPYWQLDLGRWLASSKSP